MKFTVQKIVYSESDIQLLHSMKHREFSHIYYDGCCQFVFVFPHHHIIGCATDLAAATQNRYDEAITVCFEYKSGKYYPPTQEHLLLSNSLIERIWIARTVLYFTDCTLFKSKEEAVQDIANSTSEGKILREYIEKAPSVGRYSEIVSHPNLAARNLYCSDEHSNLVDAGILVQIEDFFLSCFSRKNNIIIPALIQSQQELESDEDRKNYQLLELS